MVPPRVTDRFTYWMFVERMRLEALDRGDQAMYILHTNEGKRLAKEMHFKFPRGRGRAYG